MDLLVIAGPTASGKTSLAVEIAKLFNGEIISADSMQIYQRMNVGTAKVTVDEMQGIPHHLIDIIPPNQSFSVSDFVERAKQKIKEIQNRKKLPIIVGGTGLYIKALLYGYSLGQTNKDDSIRSKYENILQEKGVDYLHSLLEKKDKEAADNIHKNATKRVIRALEIIECTGKPLSQTMVKQKSQYDYKMLVLSIPREQLYERINTRVDNMVSDGIVQELNDIIKDTPRDVQSLSAIGYKEFFPYIDGIDSLENCIDKLKQYTRNYAKRQITFFKSFEDAVWLNPLTEKQKIFDFIGENYVR